MFSKLLASIRGQWMGALALFLVLSGGVAYAADTIGSADVINNSLLSEDLANNKAVKSADVINESLTGSDVADRSGVDTCPDGSERLGQLCVRVSHLSINWEAANLYCRDVDTAPAHTRQKGSGSKLTTTSALEMPRSGPRSGTTLNSVLIAAKDGLSPKGYIGSVQPTSTSPRDRLRDDSDQLRHQGRSSPALLALDPAFAQSAGLTTGRVRRYCVGDVAGERGDHPSPGGCLEPAGRRGHPRPGPSGGRVRQCPQRRRAGH